MNVAPATLLDPRLPPTLDDLADPQIVEVTEHAPIADYAQLDGVLVCCDDEVPGSRSTMRARGSPARATWSG